MIVKNRTETVESVGIEIKREQPQYGYFINDNGEREFGVVGTVDTYAEILRHKDDTDYSILKNYLYNNSVGKDVGIYGTRPAVVSDVNDMALMVAELNAMYNNLPKEIKVKYKNFSEVISGFSKEDLQLFKTRLDNPQNGDEVEKDE